MSRFKLLSEPASNAKLRKSLGYGYLPFGLSLAPHVLSGHNVCPQSTLQCRADCVATAGMAQVFQSIMRARIEKTQQLFADRSQFLADLYVDVCRAYDAACRQGAKLALRLNTFSDLEWRKSISHEGTGWTIFDRLEEIAPPGEIVVYDYTKVTRRATREIHHHSKIPWNLVYSRSEKNEEQCLDHLAIGGKVSVVFACRKHGLPTSWKGFPVVDGDIHDLHFLHPAGCVIGLAAKGSARGKTNGFIVGVNNVD
jgi:hypothetical protein